MRRAQYFAGWDAPQVHLQLATLTVRRGINRFLRLVERLKSPRRIVATSLAIFFFATYIANGILILSTRTPTDPARLQLWLSGGMAIYLLYHLVRCVWTRSIADLELTRAEELWLGGGPVKRSSLAVYHVNNVFISALLKTLLLSVVLACDVRHFSLLIVGLFSSLVLLEVTRLIAQRWSSGLSPRQRTTMRWCMSAIAVSVLFQIIARILASTPAGSPMWQYLIASFDCVGQVAASETLQWIALPWTCSAKLAVTTEVGYATCLHFLVSIMMLPMSIVMLVLVDARAQKLRHQREYDRLQSGSFHCHDQPTKDADNGEHWTMGSYPEVAIRFLPSVMQDAVQIARRQAISVHRYWATIVFSFTVPTLLCLSPLVTGQVTQQWFYVVGGIALCTLLLAPPALRIDFRRDLRRMQLLRSLPVRPLSMVLGQLTLPLLITFCFQWLTIIVAAVVTQPGLAQVVLWSGMLSALAVFTFSSENALFLTYPHHEKAEGVGMMIRAKLTFLGKATVIAGSLGALLAWAMICKRALPESVAQLAFITGAVMATWIVAAVSIVTVAWCWKRFDLSFDIPPE